MFCLVIKKKSSLFGQPNPGQIVLQRFVSQWRFSLTQQKHGKTIGLLFKFSRGKVGMLLYKKAADAFMQSVMPQFVRTNKPSPFRCKAIVDDNKFSAQLVVIQPFGCGTQIAITDMDTERFCNIKGAVGTVFSDEFVNEFFHTITCYP